MASIFRVAIGRCSCSEVQPDVMRRTVCDELMRRLNELRESGAGHIAKLPAYSEATEMLEGRPVRFETICEPYPNAEAIVVVRAFFKAWSRPTWVSFKGVGHMFANGLIVRTDGAIELAPDSALWEYR